MFCMNCGKVLPDDAKFCKFCGTMTDSAPSPKPAPAPQAALSEGRGAAEQPDVPPTMNLIARIVGAVLTLFGGFFFVLNLFMSSFGNVFSQAGQTAGFEGIDAFSRMFSGMGLFLSIVGILFAALGIFLLVTGAKYVVKLFREVGTLVIGLFKGQH